jgi:hypothetical protein
MDDFSFLEDFRSVVINPRNDETSDDLINIFHGLNLSTNTLVFEQLESFFCSPKQDEKDEKNERAVEIYEDDDEKHNALIPAPKQNFANYLMDIIMRDEHTNLVETKLTKIINRGDVIAHTQRKDSHLAITAPFQSGKSNIICMTSIARALCHGMSIFLFVEGIKNKEEMEGRFTGIYNKYGMSSQLRKIYRDLSQTTSWEIRDSMNKSIPKIYIGIKSAPNMGRFIKGIEGCKTSQFITIIDESDCCDPGNDGTAFQKSINTIKSCSIATLSVSATPTTTLAKELITGDNFIVFGTSPDYRGFENYNWVKLKFPVKNSTQEAHDIFKNDKNIKPFIKSFSKLQPFLAWRTKYPNKKYLFPNICLFNPSIVNEHIETIRKYICELFKNITVITYTGKGITVSGNGFNKLEERDGVIGGVLAELQTYGVEKHPLIMIISGKMCDRGISFVSNNYDELMENGEIPWHLTSMYATFSDSTPLQDISQKCARATGKFGDNISPTIYSRNIEKIQNAFALNKQIISQIKSHPKQSEYISKFSREIPVSKHKCTTLAPKYNLLFKEVDDDGFDWSKNGWFKSTHVKGKQKEKGDELEIYHHDGKFNSDSLHYKIYSFMKNHGKGISSKPECVAKYMAYSGHTVKSSIDGRVSELISQSKPVKDLTHPGLLFYRTRGEVEWSVKFNH